MKDLTPDKATLDPIEIASIDEIRALQFNRLKQSLAHAYDNVTLYRDRFDQLGVHPDDLKTLSDLAKFPFTTKSDLRDHYPFGLFAVDRSQIVRVHASSGTTGKPTVVGYTKNDISNWADLVARSLRASGVRAGDMVHNAYGYGLFTGGLGAHYGIEKLGAMVVPVSGGQTARQVMLIEDFKPKAIMVTPSYMLNILEEYHRQGIDPRNSSLQTAIFGAEPWTNSMRHEIEQAFDMHAVDIYGLSEIMGPGVANECVETKDGLHIWEDLFIPEIIDPDSGEVLADGEEGELVFTTLTKEAIPVVRYRTGDISRLSTEPCVCGRTFRRMSRVKARLDDMLIIRGVNLYPSEIEKCLLSMEELAPHYQLVVDRHKALDTLEVQVEVTEAMIKRWGRFEDGTVELSALCQGIQNLMKDSLGLTAEVKLLEPRSIPRSEGKAVRVIDKRKHQGDKNG